MSRIHVFLGPSLPHAEARLLLDATYHPPVVKGQVTALVADKPAAILVIDGVFDGVLPLWHKEILFALSQGVHVFGASGVGALRAAELDTFGMVGHGSIYQAYRTGELEDDSEVAVVHGPEELGSPPVTDPLVNIRAGLRRAEEHQRISPGTHAALLKLAREEFYRQRTWARLLRVAANQGLPENELAALERFIHESRPNPMREDAIGLLRHVADWQRHTPFAPFVPDFVFESTTFWQRVQAAHYRPVAAAAPAS